PGYAPGSVYDTTPTISLSCVIAQSTGLVTSAVTARPGWTPSRQVPTWSAATEVVGRATAAMATTTYTTTATAVVPRIAATFAGTPSRPRATTRVSAAAARPISPPSSPPIGTSRSGRNDRRMTARGIDGCGGSV